MSIDSKDHIKTTALVEAVMGKVGAALPAALHSFLFLRTPRKRLKAKTSLWAYGILLSTCSSRDSDNGEQCVASRPHLCNKLFYAWNTQHLSPTEGQFPPEFAVITTLWNFVV